MGGNASRLSKGSGSHDDNLMKSRSYAAANRGPQRGTRFAEGRCKGNEAPAGEAEK
jgi:hypothetical protein